MSLQANPAKTPDTILDDWNASVAQEQEDREEFVQILPGCKLPSDQEGKVPVLTVSKQDTVEVELGVDVYESPRGRGYITYAIKTEGGRKYRKQIDCGPEGQSYDWTLFREGNEDPD